MDSLAERKGVDVQELERWLSPGWFMNLGLRSDFVGWVSREAA